MYLKNKLYKHWLLYIFLYSKFNLQRTILLCVMVYEQHAILLYTYILENILKNILILQNCSFTFFTENACIYGIYALVNKCNNSDKEVFITIYIVTIINFILLKFVCCALGIHFNCFFGYLQRRKTIPAPYIIVIVTITLAIPLLMFER